MSLNLVVARFNFVSRQQKKVAVETWGRGRQPRDGAQQLAILSYGGVVVLEPLREPASARLKRLLGA